MGQFFVCSGGEAVLETGANRAGDEVVFMRLLRRK